MHPVRRSPAEGPAGQWDACTASPGSMLSSEQIQVMALRHQNSTGRSSVTSGLVPMSRACGSGLFHLWAPWGIYRAACTTHGGARKSLWLRADSGWAALRAGSIGTGWAPDEGLVQPRGSVWFPTQGARMILLTWGGQVVCGFTQHLGSQARLGEG